MRVALSDTELLLGALLGVMKRHRSLAAGHRARYGHTGLNAWEDQITGAMGEIVLAKALDCFPKLANGPDYRGDVGRFEVRTTSRPDGSLIVYSNDHDERLYVLVCGSGPTYEIAGAMPGREAKQARYWRTDVRHPAYFVPRQDLSPFETWMVH